MIRNVWGQEDLISLFNFFLCIRVYDMNDIWIIYKVSRSLTKLEKEFTGKAEFIYLFKIKWTLYYNGYKK